jgi:hypothetical protein
MICPKIDQCEKVSTTTRPVTHMEVVAVNSAVDKPVCCPLAVAKGSIKSPAPIKIARRKPRTMICVEVILILFL